MAHNAGLHTAVEGNESAQRHFNEKITCQPLIRVKMLTLFLSAVTKNMIIAALTFDF